MVKKRAAARKRNKNNPKKRLVRITSNPFLNYFLSICKLNGNRNVEKIARNAAVEWRRMNYLDKTPYYLLADEAKKRKKKISRKKQQGFDKYSDWDSSVSALPSKIEYLPEKMKSDSDIRKNYAHRKKIERRRKSEAVPRKKRSESVVLTSDVEDVDDLIRTTEKNLRRGAFPPSNASSSSFGLATSNTDSIDVMSSVSSITLMDTGRSLHRTYDFYY